LLKKFDVDYNADVDPEVLELAKAGRKIEAIKKFRETNEVSLKDAKQFIEQLP
jgi:ribosomal protein L7/L12